MIALDIGAGSSRLLERDFPEALVIRTDLDPRVKPDVICDARQTLPFATDSLGLVQAIHVLEHIPFPETEGVLKEWARVVKPGGQLIVAVPDLAYAAQRLLQGQVTVAILGLIFGGQYNDYQRHNAGFILPMLVGLIEDAGLVPTMSGRRPFGIKTTLPGGQVTLEVVHEIYCVGEKRNGES